MKLQPREAQPGSCPPLAPPPQPVPTWLSVSLIGPGGLVLQRLGGSDPGHWCREVPGARLSSAPRGVHERREGDPRRSEQGLHNAELGPGGTGSGQLPGRAAGVGNAGTRRPHRRVGQARAGCGFGPGARAGLGEGGRAPRHLRPGWAWGLRGAGAGLPSCLPWELKFLEPSPSSPGDPSFRENPDCLGGPEVGGRSGGGGEPSQLVLGWGRGLAEGLFEP